MIENLLTLVIYTDFSMTNQLRELIMLITKALCIFTPGFGNVANAL